VDTSSEALAREIVAGLRAKSYQAYLVGGCVRDLLLGVAPKDFDVATDARPEQVLAAYPDAQQVGAHFGVMLVCRNQSVVEVATFRSDHEYADGRRPSRVTFETSPEQDALRRDFTINALFLDPESGGVLDFVSGRADLKNGVVRAIGDPVTRFEEDRLRMLRAVRFAARFGFEIESGTLNAIRRMSGQIQSVSAERIREELVRILTEGGARRGFELLGDTGLLAEILPEIAAMKGVQQPPEYHPEGDVWTHTLLMLEGLPKGSEPALAAGVLLHDVGKPPTFRIAERIRFDGHVEKGVEMARAILSRLRFSSDDIRQVEALVANHMKFKDAPRMKDSTLKRFLRLDRFDEHLELHRLDCESSHRMLDNYEYVKAKREEFGREQIAPPRLITGNDLIEAGYSPGPEFGRLLNLIEDAQLEGRISTREQALELLDALTRRASEPPST
jgi:putative nucleotidyltransferase with HDIG domain